MKFVTFEVETPFGRVSRAGVVRENDVVTDLNAAYRVALQERVDRDRISALADAVVPTDLIELLANGEAGRDAVAAALAAAPHANESQRLDDGSRVHFALRDVKLLSPLPRPRSIRDCSAFEEHVKNTSGTRGVPKLWYDLPVYYKGNPGAVQGTETDVVRPPGVEQLDYELEFAVVVGLAGRDIAEERALDHVAGYMIFNDVSARDLQFPEMSCRLGPAKGKDFDGSNAFGPWLVTPDEFDPALDQSMCARVDGEEWSRGSTKTLYHSIPRILSYISRSETLHVGDVIGSGTVGGGCGLELGRYPSMGQVVELEIEGLGVLRNRFVDA